MANTGIDSNDRAAAADTTRKFMMNPQSLSGLTAMQNLDREGIHTIYQLDNPGVSLMFGKYVKIADIRVKIADIS